MAVTAGIAYALMAPIFRSARLEAENIQCLSNLKQLGAAFSQYQEDNDEHLPPSALWASRIQGDLSGTSSVEQACFHCPLATNTRYGYAFNSALDRRALDSFSDQSSTIVLFDSNLNGFNAAGSSANVAWHRHPNVVNFLYVDGHARALLNEPEYWTAFEKSCYKWK